MAETVRTGARRDAVLPFGVFVVLGDSCPHLASPDVSSPGRLAILGEEIRARLFLISLPLKELKSLGTQNDVSGAEFRGPTLSMGESERLPVEICNERNGELLRPGPGQLQSPKK